MGGCASRVGCLCRKKRRKDIFDEDDMVTGHEVTQAEADDKKKGRCQRLCLLCKRRRREINLRPRSWDDDFRLACAAGKVQALQRLKAELDDPRDFEVDCETVHGYCGIHAAALHGHAEVVHQLLEWQANLNIHTHAGMTPLHLAICSGHLHVVEELMLQGAHDHHDVTSLNKQTARKAFDFADQFDYEDIIDFFKELKPEDHAADDVKKLKTKGSSQSGLDRSRSGLSGGSSVSGSSQASSQMSGGSGKSKESSRSNKSAQSLQQKKTTKSKSELSPPAGGVLAASSSSLRRETSPKPSGSQSTLKSSFKKKASSDRDSEASSSQAASSQNESASKSGGTSRSDSVSAASSD